jgi:hypothetical protein
MTAEQIALVHNRPELTAVGLPGKAVRIGGWRRKCATVPWPIDLKYAAGIRLIGDAVFASIAVGPHRHVEPRTIWARDDVLGPMMVDRACGQIGNLLRRRGDLRCALQIGTPQGIRVGDVKILPDQLHARTN